MIKRRFSRSGTVYYKTLFVAGEEEGEAKGSRVMKDIASQNNSSSSEKVARRVLF